MNQERENLLGSVYWYHVYETDGNRVVKKERSTFPKIRNLYAIEGSKPREFVRSLFKLLTKRDKTKAWYQRFESEGDLRILGFPKPS